MVRVKLLCWISQILFVGCRVIIKKEIIGVVIYTFVSVLIYTMYFGYKYHGSDGTSRIGIWAMGST